MKFALVTGACINTGVAIVEKFLSEGFGVVFTGRSAERVEAAKEKYLEKFPGAAVLGYALDSLLDERTVDEAAIDALFADLDEKKIFVILLKLIIYKENFSFRILYNLYFRKKLYNAVCELCCGLSEESNHKKHYNNGCIYCKSDKHQHGKTFENAVCKHGKLEDKQYY